MRRMCDTFLTELAQAQAIPGGGAAAAFCADLALALLEKVVRLELKRPQQDPESRQVWPERLAGVQRLRPRLAELRQADGQAYLNLVAARTAGGPELRLAITAAIACPAEIARAALTGLEVTAEVGRACRRHLLADLMVVAELLRAALLGSVHIAGANLPLLTSPAPRTAWAEKLAETTRAGMEACQRVLEGLTTRAAARGGP